MIKDSETNFLYLADTLPKKYPAFWANLQAVLNNTRISYSLLPNTKDIWAVDYMPIQVDRDDFVQFEYKPDYLKPKIWLKTISDVDAICKTMNLSVRKSNIVLDGGNVIKSKKTVIMSDKVFSENASFSRKQLIEELRELLLVNHLFFVPLQPGDYTGHADGMLRMLDNHRVLINDYSREKPDFQRSFLIALHNAGFEFIQIPYNPYGNKKNSQANGGYINFLQIGRTIILPTFNIKEDDQAIIQFEKLFQGYNIASIECNEIANEGGILNCISWNILR